MPIDALALESHAESVLGQEWLNSLPNTAGAREVLAQDLCKASKLTSRSSQPCSRQSPDRAPDIADEQRLFAGSHVPPDRYASSDCLPPVSVRLKPCHEPDEKDKRPANVPTSHPQVAREYGFSEAGR